MNDEPVAWMLADKESEYIRSIMAVQHDFVPEGCVEIPLYTHPAKTLTVSKDDVANLVCSGEYWTLDDHLNIVSVHFDKFAEAILRKAQER